MHQGVSVHQSVLLPEIIDGLHIEPGDVVVDATVNGGGMSEEVLRRFQGTVSLICIDKDESALQRAKVRLAPLKGSVRFIQGNFSDIDKILREEHIEKVDRVMFDLGLSSNQLESSGRGFSFQKNEPLIMTFEQSPQEGTLTAKNIVNEWEPENIETIIRIYGEERKAWHIVKAIVEARTLKKIENSSELADIILRKVGRRGKTHPATKTFQALRIAVNDELNSLKSGLENSFSALAEDGRMAVISFHSLEDRMVKHFLKDKEKEGKAIRITKKPIVPGDEEIAKNPRSRSAKLRILKKIT